MSTILAWILGHFIATFHVLKCKLDCPGGCSDIFTHVRTLGPLFWVQNLEFQFFFFWGGGGGGGGGGGFRTMNIFWGMKLLWIFWGGGGHYCAFSGLFLRSMYGEGIFWGVPKNSNVF